MPVASIPALASSSSGLPRGRYLANRELEDSGGLLAIGEGSQHRIPQAASGQRSSATTIRPVARAAAHSVAAPIGLTE